MKTEVKAKTLIKKIDAVTIEVNGQSCHLNDEALGVFILEKKT